MVIFMVKWTEHEQIPFSRKLFRFIPRRYKSYITTKQWLSIKGKVFAIVRCTSYSSDSKGRLKVYKRTIEKVAHSYENLAKYKKAVLNTLSTMAQVSHQRHGGKSNCITFFIDYIIKYPTYYNKSKGVSRYRFERLKDKFVVYKNVGYDEGKERYEKDFENKLLSRGELKSFQLETERELNLENVERFKL